MPVMADAVERSISLAASMEVRGYGRAAPALGAKAGPLSSAGSPGDGWTRGPGPRLARGGTIPTGVVSLAAVVALVMGLFLLLGVPAARAGAWPWVCLGIGTALGVASLIAAGRQSRVTRYRPEPWSRRDSALVALGLIALAVTLVLGHTHAVVLSPSPVPARWPPLHPALVAIAASLLCAAAVGRQGTPLSATPAGASSGAEHDGPRADRPLQGWLSPARARLRPDTRDPGRTTADHLVEVAW
jgi:energy-coupling factor transport system permease protein